MSKRVIISIARLSVIVAVLLFLIVWLGRRAGDASHVTATFQTYKVGDSYKVGERESCYVAEILLSNRSSKPFLLIDGGLTTSFYLCEFRSKTSLGFTNWVPSTLATSPIIMEELKAHFSVRVQVPVPDEENPTQVAVLCFEHPANLEEPWNSLRRWWWTVFPRKHKTTKAWCDRELSYAEAHQNAK